MEVIEITGFHTGKDEEGVTYLQPKDAFVTLLNAYIYRQVLQSRLGFVQFGNRLTRELDDATLNQTTSSGTQTTITDLLNDTGIQDPSIRSSEPDALIQSGTVSISVDSGAATWDDSTTPGILTATGGTAADGTIDYVSGQIVLNFTGAVSSGLAIVVTFTYAPSLRVMGIFENILPSSVNELVVIDKNYFYVYNSTTNEFDWVPFTSADPIVTFGITSNEDYVSGTTYLASDGSQRFVFTGKGMSDIYFYDGSGILRFTNTTDNADYQAPAGGTLSRATAVLYFGERLNLFIPVIAGFTYQQGVLYSGIKDSGGNGDKFNVPGSGLINFDTSSTMKIALILGDIIIAKFQNADWALEKTRDAFNPYFPRKIPSVLGTDAGFSAVQWNYEAKSLGKTGAISTDGRQSLRFDNKIPRFTADEMDQGEFELAYGGFDRINGQFLFSFRSTTSTLADITQDQVLVYNYEESSWSVYDMRFSVFGQTTQGHDLAWQDIDETQNPAWSAMNETEEVWNKIGIEAAVQKTLAGDNYGFIYQINTDFDDYFVDISNITQDSAAIVTVDQSAFQIGDRVVFVNVQGMTQINSMIGTVLDASDTSITVNIDTRNFDAYTSGGSVSKLISFVMETIPLNPWRSAGRMINMSHVEFLIESNAGDLWVDFYVDEEEAPFKSALVVSPSNTTKKQVWIEVEVNQEANFITLVMRNESAGFQTRLTSIRIHCEPGLETNP